MNRFRSAFILLGLAVLNVLPLGAIDISTNGTYTQDFNTLATTGSTNAWTDNSTIAGWYAQSVNGFGANYIGSNGALTNIDLYSFGSTGNSNRALGSIGGTSTGNFAWGVTFRNTLGDVGIEFTDVNFAGEQWRDSGNATTQNLTFAWARSTSPITDLTPTTDVGWTQIPGLTFSSLKNNSGGGVGVALNGDLSGNRTVFTFNFVAQSVQKPFAMPGEYLMFRWFDIDHVGAFADHGLSIDDLSINYQIIPEPSSCLLILAGAAGILGRRRRS